MGGKNCMRYDSGGRLIGVTPTGWNAANMYGYRFTHNKFGDPTETFLTYKVGGERKETLLTRKEVDRLNGGIITCHFRNKDAPDVSTILLDKYGRTTFIHESDKCTAFEMQEQSDLSGESVGAAQVKQMYDPYEDRTYK